MLSLNTSTARHVADFIPAVAGGDRDRGIALHNFAHGREIAVAAACFN
jgi:hypothetical protein